MGIEFLIFLILIAILLGLVVMIRRQQAKEDMLWLGLRQKDFELGEGIKLELDMLPLTGEEVLILQADDPAWCGRSRDLHSLVTEAIVASRRLGIMKEAIVPLRLGASDKFATMQAAAIGPSYIIFQANSLLRKIPDEEGAVAHEVAHLLDPNVAWHHNPEWEKMHTNIPQ